MICFFKNLDFLKFLRFLRFLIFLEIFDFLQNLGASELFFSIIQVYFSVNLVFLGSNLAVRIIVIATEASGSDSESTEQDKEDQNTQILQIPSFR